MPLPVYTTLSWHMHFTYWNNTETDSSGKKMIPYLKQNKKKESLKTFLRKKEKLQQVTKHFFKFNIQRCLQAFFKSIGKYVFFKFFLLIISFSLFASIFASCDFHFWAQISKKVPSCCDRDHSLQWKGKQFGCRSPGWWRNVCYPAVLICLCKAGHRHRRPAERQPALLRTLSWFDWAGSICTRRVLRYCF